MSRTPLKVFALALALACSALWAHARASGVSGVVTPTRASGLYAPPVPAPTTARKVDEYGDIRWVDEKARLDNFAVELKNDPSAVGYVIGYAGRVARVADARRRIERAKRYVVSVRKINPLNVITIDGGNRRVLTVELWITPPGVIAPMTTPTIDPSEVRLIKGRAKRRRRTL